LLNFRFLPFCSEIEKTPGTWDVLGSHAPRSGDLCRLLWVASMMGATMGETSSLLSSDSFEAEVVWKPQQSLLRLEFLFSFGVVSFPSLLGCRSHFISPCHEAQVAKKQGLGRASCQCPAMV
jgi:hypothetical protein